MHEPQDSIPPELQDALRKLYEPQVQVPLRVGDAILNRARASLAGKRRSRTWWRISTAIATAAAAIAIAVVVHHQPPPQVAVAGPRDVNRDGRVDILDALQVARSSRPPATWDFNHDGKVDRRDADAIAQEVVKLTPGVLP